MRLILVRHGQTDSNVNHLLDTGFPGAPLNARGLAQAEALVEALAHEPIEAVYSSDLHRARQTAAPLAAARGLEVVLHDGLREIYAGEADMSPDWRDYVALLQRWGAEPTASLPGGENAEDFFLRYDAAVTEIVERHEVAAVVSHGAALRIWAVHHSVNVTFADTDPWPLENTDTIVLEGSFEGGWRMVRWATFEPDAAASSDRVVVPLPEA